MILVDPLLQWPNARGVFRAGSCHMASDLNAAELHEFAVRLGLKRRWAQHVGTRHEHYDLTAAKRELALRLGAVPVSCRELLRRNFAYVAWRAQAADR